MKAIKSTSWHKDGDYFETFKLKKNGNQRIVVKKNGKINQFIKFRLIDGVFITNLIK